jgi:sec-independent protein translocase protein TatA
MLMIVPLFIGTSELLLIAALVLLLFGGKKLPEMMRGMGKGVKAFKEGMNDNTDDTAPKQLKENSDKTEKSNDETAAPNDGQQKTV